MNTNSKSNILYNKAITPELIKTVLDKVIKEREEKFNKTKRKWVLWMVSLPSSLRNSK